jgi:hypothetical protein
MAPSSDSIRAELEKALTIITPYVRSQGSFHNWGDLAVAIELALDALEKARAQVARFHP